jgi:acyl-CoA thioester hydrolase
VPIRRLSKHVAWFETAPDAPAPLKASVTRRVRFEEVDSMGIVWHGHYPSYFEDARVALGRKYGVGYEAFYANRVPAPIKQLHVDYRLPLRFDEEVEITALLHWSEAARMNYEFAIRKEDGRLSTTGCSIQLMLNPELELLVIPPPFYQEFCRRWEAGELK